MDLPEYTSTYADDGTPGWDAIDAALQPLYGDQEPRHFAAVPHYALGGENPLDGISAYSSSASGILHEHLVTYGFSELYYDPEAFGKEFSKFGFELTMRLKIGATGEDIHWCTNLLQNIAKYVFTTGNYFEPLHYMSANGKIRIGYDTKLEALAFVEDPELGCIDTPHGKVQFLQVVGLTKREYDRIRKARVEIKRILAVLQQDNPLLITDLDRDET